MLSKQLIILSQIFLTIMCTISMSHINLKTIIKATDFGGNILMYDANLDGEVLVTVMRDGFNVYKMVGLDYYRRIGSYGVGGIVGVSVGDVVEIQEQYGNWQVVYLGLGFKDSVSLYKITLNTQKTELIHRLQTTATNLLSNKHRLPYLTIQTNTSLQIYNIHTFTKQLSYPYTSSSSNRRSILTSNRARNQIVVVEDGRIIRISQEYKGRVLKVEEEQRGDGRGKVVGVSVSRTGREIYLAYSGLINTINHKINNILQQFNNKTATNTQISQNKVLAQMDPSMRGMVIDKTGKYVAYVKQNSLNLGRLVKNQVEHIKSYNLSKACDPFGGSDLIHLQYIYEERLIIPCSMGNISRLVIFHTCQAEACSNFCGIPCGNCVVEAQLGQQCDDCNTVDGDGCSSVCLIEPPPPPPTPPQSPLTAQIKPIYIQKYDTQNKLQLKLQITTDATIAWSDFDLNNAITITGPAGTISSYQLINDQNGNFYAIISYSGDLQDQQISFGVNLAMLGVVGGQVYTTPVTVLPDDNQAAYLYDDAIYQTAHTVKILGIVAVSLGLFFFLLGIVAGKIIGIEMMAVIQISYLSLISLRSLNPALNMLSQLHFVNGYNNLYFNKQYLLQSQLTKVKGVTLFPKFLQNYNYTMLLVFVPLLVGLVLFIVSKVAGKDWEKYWKRLIGQYTFNGLMFCGYVVGVALGLEFLYEVNDQQDFIGVGSMFFAIFFILLYALYFLLLILKPQIFGQFTNFFNQNNIDPKFYLLLIPERLLIGMSLILLLSNPLSPLVVICLYAAFGLITIIRRPYLKLLHNIRFLCNMAIAIAIQIIYLCYNLETVQDQNKKSVYNQLLPILVVVLLLICVLYSGAAIIWQIVTYIRSLNQEDKPDIQKQKQQTKRSGEDRPDDKNEQKKASNRGANNLAEQIEQTRREMLIQAEKVHEGQNSRRGMPGQQTEGQKFELANKIKKQLIKNFGLSNSGKSEIPSNRQRIIYDKDGPNNYRQM